MYTYQDMKMGRSENSRGSRLGYDHPMASVSNGGDMTRARSVLMEFVQRSTSRDADKLYEHWIVGECGLRVHRLETTDDQVQAFQHM
jgi:hypothetical protein